MTEKQFVWVPFIKELADKISDYRTKQSELIEILKGIIEKHRINLGTTDISSFEKEKFIDPFSAITITLYSNEPKDKRLILNDLKTMFQLSSQIPNDIIGFVSTSATFSFTDSKNPKQEMEMLWKIFDEVKVDDVREETFNKILKVVNAVNITSITTSLSWIRPEKYIRLNFKVNSYLLNKFGINFKQIHNWQRYQNAIKKIMETETNLSEVYYQAYQIYLEEQKKDEDKENNKMTKSTDSDSSDSTDYPLNTILYGPPGTGKTYNVINKALQIIDPAFYTSNIKNRELLKNKFDELQKSGQIAFVTFHQSYGYEEFIEGIKPIAPLTDDNQTDNIIYDIKKGIFASTCETASKNYYQSKKTSIYKDFDSAWRELFKQIDFSNNEKLTVNMKKSEFYITDFNNKTIRFEKKEGSSVHTLSIESLKKMYETGNNYFQGGLKTYYDALLNRLNAINISTNEEPLQKFVIIIDEINRGNISKIFGELITLIEDSKRLGKPEELKIKLPYSNEDFGVPSNLYIIGTMNTADRSIALMDTALRRRFVFEEMMPQPELLVDKDKNDLEVNGINLRLMLTKINERIEFLYDRDHTIGHAYFIGLTDLATEKQYPELCSIFKNKIIPLLQEYFYDDWEKIQIVLGDHIKQLSNDKEPEEFIADLNKIRFVQSRIFKEENILGFNHEDYENKIKYQINQLLTSPEQNLISPEAFIKIYQPKAQ